MADQKEIIVIAVDCGSASIRASLIRFVDGVLDGHTLATYKQNTTIYNPMTDLYEQNTTELWTALGICIRKCLEKSKVNYKQISGISFSATCSLVIIEETQRENDVFMWMDHRAIKEAADITNTKNAVLEQMGGTCSVEFSLAKLYWLFRNRKERFDKATAFMELPDFFAWKCSNLEPKDYPRSVCSVVCKWGYDAVNKTWRDDLFTTLGMDEFVKDKSRIGSKIVLAGTHIGYMSKQAAFDLGLIADLKDVAEDTIPISIASPLIDAHAGALSMCMFSHELKDVEDEHLDYDNMWCMIGGTSTCDFISTHQRYFTQGVWGPYYDAIFPGYYVREAGQSTTGILMEHVIKAHPDYHNIHKDKPIHEVINFLNEKLLKKPYMSRLNVNPCYHGSRLLAFPNLRGGIYGLTMDPISLKESYHAIVEALVYESKYILDELRIPNLKKVLVSGGLSKNELYMQVCADVLNIEVLTFSLGSADLMLVGAALLAFHSIHRTDLNKKIAKYPKIEAKRYKPTPELRRYHDLKYRCFREMLDSACKIETLMEAIQTKPKNHDKKKNKKEQSE